MVLYGVCTIDYSRIRIYRVLRETPKTYIIYSPLSKRAVPISIVRKETMSTATERFFLEKDDAAYFVSCNMIMEGR